MNWWLILKYQERVCELYESLENYFIESCSRMTLKWVFMIWNSWVVV